MKSFEAGPNGLAIQLATGTMRLEVVSEGVVRVRQWPGGETPAQANPVLVKDFRQVGALNVTSTPEAVSFAAGRGTVSVNRADSTVTFTNDKGLKLITLGPGRFTPAVVNGEQTYEAELASAVYGSQEGLYGLGQHQAGVWNYRGSVVELSQENTEIAIPMLVSSNGYGLFWNNPSRTRFNNRFVHSLYIHSEVADAIDYFFVFGPSMDTVISTYRQLTGGVPLYGKWAYGFWQCKNKYESQEELLGVARKYRELHIPVDNIVQDWFWWNRKGEHIWNSKYPNPKGMVDELHEKNFHLMVSVWPFYDKGTPIYDEFDRKGFFVDRLKVGGFHPLAMALYDATNPEARKRYWEEMDKALFKIGADAWWLDTIEPETEGQEKNILLDHKLAIGSGNRFANLYPLMSAMGVHDGQRAESDKKRVYILGRSAYAGSQRYGVTAWSGDILSNWLAYKRQIPAGLNYALSGMPYWTTDIGGFFIGNPEDKGFRELFVRWFQFGAFSPIFRVHGTRTTNQNELWSYGPEVQKIVVEYDRLRYKLMPYTYSVAWKTTSENYTPMRPLIMDFASDARTLDIGDEYMYGPSILVAPVTEPGVTVRATYLPKGGWFDYWTGAAVAGGQTVQAAAPLDRLPLYVKAGSIVPMGPAVEYAAQKSEEPIELRVYRGADAKFVLYEDENDGYNYEKGVYATIPVEWNEAAKTLTVGARKGTFPGMVERRKFKVAFVGGVVREVEYSGAAVTVKP